MDESKQTISTPQATAPISAPVEKKGGSSCLKIGAIVAVIGIGFIILVVFLAVWGTSGLTPVAEKQLSLLKENNVQAAYDMTSSEYKKENTFEDFQALIQQYPALLKNEDSSFSSREVTNGVGTIEGELTATDGTKTPIRYQLIKENGLWKIAKIDVVTSKTETKNETATTSKLKIVDIKVSDTLNNKQIVDAHKNTLPGSTEVINATLYMDGAVVGDKVGIALIQSANGNVVDQMTKDIDIDGSIVYNFIFTRTTDAWPAGEYQIYAETPGGETGNITFTVE